MAHTVRNSAPRTPFVKSMALPRLPSGIYWSMLADSVANEENHIREYPTFPVTHQTAEIKQLHHTGHTRSLTAVDPHLSLPPLPAPQLQLCLPLLGVSIDMQVDFNIAKTRLVQTFTNHGNALIPEAWYSFPLYDGAAVTAFRCEVGDEKVLEGKMKPKDEARQEFNRAVKKQEVAALVEEMAPDVFQTTIGNIKPRTTVKVQITYVEELHTDLSGKGIVVTIPTSVAPRYGTPPTGYATNSAIKEVGLSLVVSVASPGPTGNITCRSGHNISVDYGTLDHMPEADSFEALAELRSQADPGINPNHATARLTNDQIAMDRDFILYISSAYDSLPMSCALLAPPSGSELAAMMVTVHPSELFSDLQESMNEFDGEIIFLADRSGSMAGSKMEQLKDGLLLFLKSIPAKCKFNLYSFGNYVASLWPQSMPYDESTLGEALCYLSTFQANFGGTEVLNALRKAVDDRRLTDASSTQLILLTDGEIWQPEQTIEFVRMKTSEAEGQLRFFSLGIGNQVSHQLLQGIGFFGGGFGEAISADADGKWKEAVIRMLKGALMPKSWSYSISFGDQWREKRLAVDSFSLRQPEKTASGVLDRIAGPVNPSFVQAPGVIPELHHFRQQSVFFLLENNSGKLPDHVMITACSQYGGNKTATLTVTKATANNTIQHLAAKAAVRDLENQDTPEAASPNHIRKNAEQLSQMYTISSKWMSFVAVSHLQQSAEYENVGISQYKAALSELDLLARPGISLAGANLPWAGRQVKMHDVATLLPAAPGATGCCPLLAPPSDALNRIRSGRRQTKGLQPLVPSGPVIAPAAQGGNLGAAAIQEVENDELRPAPSIPRPARNACLPRKPNRTQVQNELRSQPAPHTNIAPGSAVSYSQPDNRAPTPAVGPWQVDWQDFVRCQRADGLFQPGKSLERRMAQHFCHGTRGSLRRWLAGRVREPPADYIEDDGSTWMLVNTVMVLAYIRSHFYELRALWDLMVQKAEGRLASLLNPGQWERPDGLAAMADSALAHAHYGRCSQGSGEVSWWTHGPISGRCGVCHPQSEERPSSVTHDDDLEKCSVSRCDISVGKWDDFWAHAVEQGHIYSSCEAASIRYSVAIVKDRGGNLSGYVQKAERKVVQGDAEDKDGQNQSATLKRKRDVADVV